MSKGKWRFSPSETKRAIRALEDAGLKVTQVRFGEDGLTVNTQTATQTTVIDGEATEVIL
jgi:hypothetical protein